METTFTLARYFNVTPFVLYEQDTDDVIMTINHYIEKAAFASSDPAPVQKKNKQQRIKVNDKTASGGWF